MAGYIAEFFGYNASDNSEIALKTAARKNCPFLGNFCVKTLARDKVISGVCAIRQKTPGSPNVICCPIRLYADNFKMLHEISEKAFRCTPVVLLLKEQSRKVVLSQYLVKAGAEN